MKRYVVTVDFYVYEDDDIEVQVIGQNAVDNLNKMADCDARVTSIHEVPFGTIGEGRKVEI